MLGELIRGQGLRDALTSVMACARQSEAELGPGRSESETQATAEDRDRPGGVHREAPVLVRVGKSRELLG